MSENPWVPFHYRDFWDFPRMLVVPFEGGSMLLECVFDDELDDYSPEYEVFRLPPVEELTLTGDWSPLRDRILEFLGRVTVHQVLLDETRRRLVNLQALMDALPGCRLGRSPASGPEPSD